MSRMYEPHRIKTESKTTNTSVESTSRRCSFVSDLYLLLCRLRHQRVQMRGNSGESSKGAKAVVLCVAESDQRSCGGSRSGWKGKRGNRIWDIFP